MRQESELEIRGHIHFAWVKKGKDAELVQVDHIDIGFLHLWFFFGDHVNTANTVSYGVVGQLG